MSVSDMPGDEFFEGGSDAAPPASGPRRSELPLLFGPEIAAALPPLAYHVREIGLVAGSGAPHLIAGYGFGGKTLAAQALLLARAAGVPVWGAFGGRDALRVTHVDCEQGERLTRRRYQRLALAMGVDLSALGEQLALSAMPPIKLSAGYADEWEELMAGRDLLLVDSLRAATGGLDENDSSIRMALDLLGTLSEKTGCRALVIHHARKPGDDATGGRYSIRGSSAIYDACDSVYVFSAEKGEPVLVEHVKARSHGEPTESVALVIEDVASGTDPRAGVRVVVHGGELVAQKREAKKDAAAAAHVAKDAAKLIEVITRNPGLGKRELGVHAGLSNGRVTAAVAQLLQTSVVEVREELAGRTKVSRHYPRSTSTP